MSPFTRLSARLLLRVGNYFSFLPSSAAMDSVLLRRPDYLFVVCSPSQGEVMTLMVAHGYAGQETPQEPAVYNKVIALFTC